MISRKFWQNKKVLVTGVSFIGSHLVDKLVELGSDVRIVNLTKKHLPNFKTHVDKKRVEFYTRDLRDLRQAKKSVKDMDIIFHLACDHGGRGYVDLHQGATSSNFLLDGSVFWAGLKEGVEKIVFASSVFLTSPAIGCVVFNWSHLYPQPFPKLKARFIS